MLDPAFGHWLAGFIDGEGCFIIHMGGPRSPQGPVLLFEIRLRDDDRPLLLDVQAQTGLGRVRNTPSYQPHRPNANPSVAWVINRKAEVLRLIAIPDEYPMRSRKYRDYEVWKRAAQIHSMVRPGARDERQKQLRAQILQLRDELRSTRKYNPSDLKEAA